MLGNYIKTLTVKCQKMLTTPVTETKPAQLFIKSMSPKKYLEAKVVFLH